MISYIIPFLILISIVVFIHEYGHYYFAKRYGVKVTDFSIGFGRELFSVLRSNAKCAEMGGGINSLETTYGNE